MRHLFSVVFFVLLAFGFNSSAWAQGWQWARSVGYVYDDAGSSIAMDAAGNVYVVGYYKSGTVIFGHDTLGDAVAGDNMFVTKYSPSGNVAWAKTATVHAQEDNASSVAVDGACNVYVAGGFLFAPVTFGSDTLRDSGFNNIFLVKYDSSGQVIWARSAGGATVNGNANSIGTDAAGNIYMAGSFTSASIRFGSITLTNAGAVGSSDLFLVKYDSSGNLLWASRAGNTGNEVITSLAIDASGAVVVCGVYDTTNLVLGSTVLTNTTGGLNDIFLAKYSASGSVLWAKSAGGLASSGASSVASDPAGNIYLTGNFNGPFLDIGPVHLTNPSPSGGDDIYIAKFDGSGNTVWAIRTGGLHYAATGNCIKADATGHLYWAGTFAGASIVLGGDSVTGVGTGDMLMAVYDTAGNMEWMTDVAAPQSETPNSLVTGAAGEIYVTGAFTGINVPIGPGLLFSVGDADIFVAKIAPPLRVPDMHNPVSVPVLFPNPGTQVVTIDLQHATFDYLTIFNCLGEKLVSREISASENAVQVDIAKWPDGVYYAVAHNSDGSFSIPFEVRH